MTIESYSLPFHLAQAENSQDVQNRYLMYQNVQSGQLEEEAKKRALLAQQQVQDAEEAEGRTVDKDGKGGAEERGRAAAARAAEEDDDERPREDDDRGNLIDVVA